MRDALDLGAGKRVAIVADGAGLTAVPEVRDADGCWRRGRPGDGVAEALLALLARGSTTVGNFAVQSWTRRNAHGERTVGVDQTNESVIVGDAAVVKWATHLQEGPHPAPRRIGVLRDAGFGGMPAPWGLVVWTPRDGDATLVASVDAYLPGAVDGWTWAVELITAAARNRTAGPFVRAATAVGTVVAELHAGLAGTATVATRDDAQRWREDAVETLDIACAVRRSVHTRHGEIIAILDGLATAVGSPVIEGHGDLHVGQVLLSQDRFVVTDFDGNPVLPAPQRMLPIPAALDVASMVQSLAHAAIVAARYTAFDSAALAEIDVAGRAAFLRAYLDRLGALGHAELYAPNLVHAFRVQQVLREVVYAARHLTRWMYVPDAALPAVLDEGMHP